VNAQAFNGGSSVLFNAAQTFVGNIAMGTSNAGSSPAPSSTNPLTFGSTGAATIAPASGGGFAATNQAGIAISNLTFVGSGDGSDGVNFTNNQAGNTTLDYIKLTNVTVSGFGQNGIMIYGGNGNSGFSNITLINPTSHGNTGNWTGTTGGNIGGNSAGIQIVSGPGYQSGTQCHTNVSISGATVYSNTGTAGDTTNWTGGGIVIGESGGTISITLSHTYSNGANNNYTGGGPVGTMVYDSYGTITCSFSESDHNHTNSTHDGDGYNIDQGVLEYCYSHDNDGIGALVDSYATANTHTVRYCIFQNNNVKGVTNGGEIVLSNYSGSATMTDQIYNNTVYSAQPCLIIAGVLSTFSGNIANNIFYSANGSFVSAGASPTGSINNANLKMNANDYFTTGTFSLTWNGTTYTSFASWKSAQSQEATGSLTNPVVNPSLTSPGGGGTTNGYSPGSLGAYGLQSGSPMFGAGLNLNSLFSINPGTQDYYGDRIPHGAGSGFPVGAAGAITTPRLPLLGAGMIGWRAALPLAAVWKLSKAIAKNGVITRRRLLLLNK
jgi:hypothetical protein